jgi:hypothetical protein
MSEEDKAEVLIKMRIAIAELRTSVDLQFRNAERALEKQADEYERRLSILNGEAQRLKDMQIKYLPRETFETIQRENSAGRRLAITIASSAMVSLLVTGLMLLFGR